MQVCLELAYSTGSNPVARKGMGVQLPPPAPFLGNMMRMWMVDPKLMCMQHLVGEHGEIHKHRHNFVKGHGIAGRKGQIEPEAMKRRHDELVTHLRCHKSQYEQPDLSGYDLNGFIVDVAESLAELSRRCPKCRELIEETKQLGNMI